MNAQHHINDVSLLCDTCRENDEVTPADIYDAASRTDCFDFLTNRFMGVKLEDQPLSQTRVVSNACDTSWQDEAVTSA